MSDLFTKNREETRFPRIPLSPLQMILDRAAGNISKSHPELFERLGNSALKTFCINPTNLPFAFVLKPNPQRPVLKALYREDMAPCDAKISGTLLTLLDMLEGRIDGDALFFRRDLRIEGDTEAVVALRNSCDNSNGNLVEELLAPLGRASRSIRMLLSILRKHKERRQK